MVSGKYDIDEFIKHIKAMDLINVIVTMNHELCDARTNLKGSNKKENGGDGTLYIFLLRSFLYFLQTGKRPLGLRDEDFNKLLPVVQNLVNKKMVNAKYLTAFDIEP